MKILISKENSTHSARPSFSSWIKGLLNGDALIEMALSMWNRRKNRE